MQKQRSSLQAIKAFQPESTLFPGNPYLSLENMSLHVSFRESSPSRDLCQRAVASSLSRWCTLPCRSTSTLLVLQGTLSSRWPTQWQPCTATAQSHPAFPPLQIVCCKATCLAHHRATGGEEAHIDVRLHDLLVPAGLQTPPVYCSVPIGCCSLSPSLDLCCKATPSRPPLGHRRAACSKRPASTSVLKSSLPPSSSKPTT